MMDNELVYATLSNGSILHWIRKTTTILGDRRLPFFYTSFRRGGRMVHSQMMDDFGNLVDVDCYEFLRGERE